MEKKKCILVDVDGTLAKMKRGPGERSPFDWHRVGEDNPNMPIINLVKTIYHTRDGSDWINLAVIILTGRDLVVGMSPQYLGYYFVVLGCSIPLFFLGLVLYRISIPVIVERMSA